MNPTPRQRAPPAPNHHSGSDLSGLTTHILDTAHGRPAAGVLVRLFRLDGSRRRLVTETRTNNDGRTDAPLLSPAEMAAGTYEIEFHLGPYFAVSDLAGDPPFLDVVPVRVGISNLASHYHVPLLASPWSYSTYRGS